MSGAKKLSYRYYVCIVYHIQSVRRVWIAPLQLQIVHWNNRHSGVSERRWAKFCVEEAGTSDQQITNLEFN